MWSYVDLPFDWCSVLVQHVLVQHVSVQYL
jgi:hypothetical protein